VSSTLRPPSVIHTAAPECGWVVVTPIAASFVVRGETDDEMLSSLNVMPKTTEQNLLVHSKSEAEITNNKLEALYC